MRPFLQDYIKSYLKCFLAESELQGELLDLLSSQAFVLYNYPLNRHTSLLIAWIYTDLKLGYRHIKEVSFPASVCKGSLRVLCFKRH